MNKQILSRVIAFVAMLCLPFLAITAWALSAPSSVSVGSLTPTTGTLQWEVEYASVHDYDIIVSTQSLTASQLGNATIPCSVTASTPGVVVFASKVSLADVTSYPLSGLTGGTHYYAYIRQNGESQYEDHSSWVSLEFSTPCVATSVLPVTADFDGGNILPSCWMSGTISPSFNSSIKHGTSGYSIMLSASSSDGCSVYSPVFAADAHAYYLSAYVYGAEGAIYRVGVAAANDLLQVENVLEGTISAANTWQPIDAAVPAEIRAELEQGVEYVWVIYNSAADGAKSFFVDDVEINELPSCIAPIGLSASNIGSASVTLSWTERSGASSWMVEYTSGDETLTTTTSANPFTLTGLRTNTSYQIRVKSLCSATDESAWSQMISLKTECGVFAIPFVEDFESQTLISECWYQQQTEVATGTYGTDYGDNCWKINMNASNAHSSTQSLQLQDTRNGTHTILVLPAVHSNAANELEFSFWMYRTTGTSKNNEGVKVWVNNAPSLDGATALMHVTRCGGVEADSLKVDPISASGWYEYAHPLPLAGDIYVILEGISEYGSSTYVDDLRIAPVPTCIKPKDLHLSARTLTDVTLAWTAGAEERSWELKYRLDSAAVQTVTVSNTPEYTISGLEPSTAYRLSSLSLRAICSADDSSEEVTFDPIFFKTACGVVNLPYREDFNSYTMGVASSTTRPANELTNPDCWTVLNESGSSSVYPQAFLSGYANYCVSGNSFFVKMSKTTPLVAVLPDFQLTQPTSLLVAFTYRNEGASSINGHVQLGYLTDASDASSFVMLKEYAQLTVMTAIEEVIAVPANAFVAFRFVGGTGDNYYASIDDLYVSVAPNCARPSTPNLTLLSANSVYVEINDADSTHTAWQVAFGEEGFDPDASEAEIFDMNSRTATIHPTVALVDGHRYSVYARTVCSGSDWSDWSNANSAEYVDVSSVSNIALNLNEGSYPWEIVNADGVMKLQSTNKGVHNTTSDLTAVVEVGEGERATLSFDYFASGEGTSTLYDYLCVYLDWTASSDLSYLTDFAQSGRAGTPDGMSGTYTLRLTPGVHTIRWRFRKDGSSNGGQDLAQVWNIHFVSTAAWAPTDVELVSATATGATLSWTQCADVVKNEVLLGDQIFETTSNSITLAELASSTVYTVRVRSILASDTTEWSDEFKFRTECAAFAIPYAESFEAEASELCWNTIGNAVTRDITSAAFDGDKALKITNDSVAGLLVSPQLDAASLADYEVSLAINLATVRYQGDLKPLTIGVMTDPTDVSTYIDLGDIVIPSAGSWKEYRFSLADLATPDYADWAGAQYVVVSMSDSATYYFDAFTVATAASCPKPTALDIQPNGEGVVVSWVSDAASHYAQLALGDSIIFAGNVENPFSPEGLEGNTLYKVRVRAICDADSSEWTPWTRFTTPCHYAEVPFAEGFEDYTDGTFPDCWSRSILSGPGTTGFVVNTTTGTSYIHTGSRSMRLSYMSATTHSLAVMPMFHSATEGELMLSFWMYRTTGSAYANEGVKVWVNNVPSLEGATALMHVTRCGGVAADSLKVSPITTSGWYQYEAVLPISGPTYVLFEGISEGGSSTYLDDIEVKAAPACMKPSALHVESVTTNSVQLAWTPGFNETTWQLIYKLSTKMTADTVMVSGAPEYTISNLHTGTSYTLSDISLQAICSAENESEVASISDISFDTECAPFVNLPFEEDFNGLTSGIPACWNNEEGTTTSASYRWNYYETGYTGHALRFNSYNNSENNTNLLKTPVINVGNDTQVNISFMYMNPAGGEYAVIISHDGGVTFTDTLASHLRAASWAKLEAQVPVAAGEHIALAFYGKSNYGATGAYLYLDNLVVSSPNACNRPDALLAKDVTSESAIIDITDPNGSAWEYVLNDPEAAPVAVSTSSFTLTGLSSLTEYMVFVRRVCGEGEVSAWTSINFTTLPSCVAPANLYFLEATSTTIKMQIEDEADATAWEYAVNTKDNPVAVNDTIFTLTGLTPDTDYTIYVRRACSEANKSAWTSSTAFTTQTPVDAVYEDFEGSNSFSGWVRLSATSNSYPYVAADGGDHALIFGGYASTPYTAIFSAPEVTGDLTDYRFMIDARKVTYDALGDILIGVADAMGAEITYVDSVTLSTSDYTTYSFGFSSYTGTGKFPILAIRNLQTTAYIDNIAIEPIPMCERPQAVSTGIATSTSVDVVITDDFEDHSEWEVVVVSKNAAASTGTPVTVSSKTVTMEGNFVSGAEYDVYVRSVCSDGYKSNFTGPATFKFVDYSAASDIPMSGTGSYPWEMITDDDDNSKLQSTNYHVGSSESDILATVVVPAGSIATVSFQYYVSSESASYDYLCMYVDQPSPSTSNYHSGFGKKGGNSGEGGSYSLVLNEGTHTILWRYRKDSSIDGGGDRAQIWNVQVAYSGFYTPSNLGVEELEATSAKLTWSAGYDVVLSQLRLFSAVDTTEFNVTGNLLQVEGLTENTAYNFIVRGFNAAGDSTAWSSPLAFTTPYACPAPQSVDVVSITPAAVNVTITDADDAHAAWQVAFGPRGFNPDAESAQIIDAATTLVSFVPSVELQVGAQYDVYARANCGEGEYSFWTAVKTVKYQDVSTVSNHYLNLSEGAYPWEIIEDNGIMKLQSTNQGVASSVSDFTTTVVVREGETGHLSFNYFASGEGTTNLYDYLCIYLDQDAPSTDNFIKTFEKNGKAGTPDGVSGTYMLFLEPGTHTIRWRFRKDGSTDAGADLAQVWNIIFVSTNVVVADTLTDSTCSGGDYENFGLYIPADSLKAGLQTYRFTRYAVNELEADTVKTLQLFISEPSVVQIQDTICAHEHYTGYGFDIADVDPLHVAPYVRHYENQFGCDSAVYLTLFVPQTEYAQTVHKCEGETYLFGDTTITTSGVYVRSFENQFGCDSTITLQIFFHGIASAVEASICPGETYTLGEQTLTQPGTYTATFTNAAGCDSIVTLTLTVIQPTVTYVDGVFCEGTTFAGAAISPKFMGLSAPGTYTDTLKSVITGCDSIIVLNLVEERIQHTTVNGTYSDGKPFVYDGQSYQEEGSYEVIKSTVNGCDSIITIVVTKTGTAIDNLELAALAINPNPVHVGEEAVIRTDIALADDYVLRVYDAVGRLVVQTDKQNGRVPALPVAGIYTVRITAAAQSFQTKLIVK